jgi:hypothetical protein
MTVAKEIPKHNVRFSRNYRRSEETEVALNQQRNIHPSTERPMRITN